MNLLPMASIQVEVEIQDCFFLEKPALGDGAIAPPISESDWADWFCRWLRQLQPDCSPNAQYELSLRLTTDEEIQQLNAQYRHKDQPTDVLAFAALENEAPVLPVEFAALQQADPLYLGDIVISVETAVRQAQERQHELREELAGLATHGLLHLLGWDHPNEESLIAMLKQQSILMQTVGLDWCWQ